MFGTIDLWVLKFLFCDFEYAIYEEEESAEHLPYRKVQQSIIFLVMIKGRETD